MEYYLYADSNNRDMLLYPNGNSYTLHLTRPLKNVSSVDLISAKIQNSVYNLQNGTNSFQINSIQFSIPAGFYTPDNIASYISSISGLCVTYLSSEGLFNFTWTNAFTLSVSNAQLQKLLGVSTATASIDSTGMYSVKSTNIVDFSTNEFIFLDIDELRNQYVIDSKKIIGNSFDGATIATSFSMIPMDVPYMTVKTFKETTDYKISVKFDQPIPSISRLTVRWLDRNGSVINFNGVNNNSFLLRVHCQPSAPPEPPKETEYEILARKLERAIQDAIPPPKPEKKKPWLIPLIVTLVGIIIYLFISRSNQVMPPPVQTPRIPMQRV